MKEYRIMQQIGEGKPFFFFTYHDFNIAYLELLKLIKMHQDDIKKEYYVLNDFYDNKYPPFLPDIKKFWIEEREVDSWVMCTKDKQEKKNSKIIKMRFKEK